MGRGLWIAIAGIVVLAVTAGAAAGKNQTAPPRSDQGAANGKAVGQRAPALVPAQQIGAGQSPATTLPPSGSTPVPGGSATTGGATGNGANVPGPYDPSGVGLPSGNGRSESNNGNRPCAGCVGRADAKNPPGQLPGGSDSNRGYECDENQGIGKTNPAHSGCSPASTVPPTITPTTPMLPLITPAALSRVPALVPVSNQVAGDRAAGPDDASENRRADDDLENPLARNEYAGVTAYPRQTAQELAFTGLGLAWMVSLGAAFIALGGAVHRRDRASSLT